MRDNRRPEKPVMPETQTVCKSSASAAPARQSVSAAMHDTWMIFIGEPFGPQRDQDWLNLPDISGSLSPNSEIRLVDFSDRLAHSCNAVPLPQPRCVLPHPQP